MAIDASSLVRFAEKCYRMPVTIDEVNKTGIGAAALVTKKTVLEAAKGRGWPSAGKKAVRVKYQVTPSVAKVELVGGFSYMFEGGAKSHREPRAKGRKSGHVINIPGVGTFDHIQHPGFKGRGFWHEGIAAASPLVAGEFQKGLSLGLRKVFH